MKATELTKVGTPLEQRIETALIHLAHGSTAIIDRADENLVRPYRWFLSKSGNRLYAYAKIPGTRDLISLHRLLLSAGLNEVVDHKNGDGLDNRRENLRRCSQSQNIANSRKHLATASSTFKGVYRTPYGWRAQIGCDGKKRYLGTFPTELEAAQAYDRAARLLFGEFARCNFPEVQHV